MQIALKLLQSKCTIIHMEDAEGPAELCMELVRMYCTNRDIRKAFWESENSMITKPRGSYLMMHSMRVAKVCESSSYWQPHLSWATQAKLVLKPHGNLHQHALRMYGWCQHHCWAIVVLLITEQDCAMVYSNNQGMSWGIGRTNTNTSSNSTSAFKMVTRAPTWKNTFAHKYNESNPLKQCKHSIKNITGDRQFTGQRGMRTWMQSPVIRLCVSPKPPYTPKCYQIT